ncbi:MAG: hypothetical protein Q8Q06_00075 [bacterium]|nr:hypothetical protein [bacterium]
MRTFSRLVSIEVFTHIDIYQRLIQGERELLKRACEVRNNAQAPYSNYWVGCAVLGKNGHTEVGCNVENGNWSETVHAEENAISSMVSKFGPFSIRAMAVVGAPADKEISWPPVRRAQLESRHIQCVQDVCPSCGHCLQLIAENCFDEKGLYDPSVVLLGYNEGSGEVYRTTIGHAYPMPFLPQHLGINYAKDPRAQKNF